MPGDGELFDFSDRQRKLLILLSVTALLLTTVYLSRLWLVAPDTADHLPLILGDQPVVLSTTFSIDPNHSPADSLELLPGIGPVLAARIVAFRTGHRFDSLADLRQVAGINDKLLESLSPYLRIQP